MPQQLAALSPKPKAAPSHFVMVSLSIGADEFAADTDPDVNVVDSGGDGAKPLELYSTSAVDSSDTF